MVWLIVICIFIVLKLVVKFTNARCKSKVCLIGKTALITGANSGIGLQLAKELASRGCSIIIADKTNASATVKNIINETHNSNITCKVVDFASFKSVRSFAEEVKKDVSQLDILVNNAGIGDTNMKMTEDGIQEIMQVNFFSHFLLTHLLLDLLLKASPSRIIYTSSIAAYKTNLTEKNITAEVLSMQSPLCTGPYGNSKLAGAIMSKLLTKKLEGTGVTSNTFHPGIVKTNIWNSAQPNKFVLIYVWWFWAMIFGKDIDEGVQTLLHLACADEVANLSGKFFMECRPMRQPYQVHDKTFCAKIWDVTEKHVKLAPNERIEQILEKRKLME